MHSYVRQELTCRLHWIQNVMVQLFSILTSENTSHVGDVTNGNSANRILVFFFLRWESPYLAVHERSWEHTDRAD